MKAIFNIYKFIYKYTSVSALYTNLDFTLKKQQKFSWQQPQDK